MHIIPFPTYIHFLSILLGCFVTHAPVQNQFCYHQKPCRSVGQQSTNRSHLESKGRQFLGTNRGDPNAPSCATIRTIAGVCYPQALSTPNRLKAQDRVDDTSKNQIHLSKIISFSKNTTRAIISLFKTSKIAYSS